MSELYINLPQLKKVPAELSGIPQDIRRKIQSLDSIEQYVKSQISGGGELQRQIQSIREELERIANNMGSYGDALQQICGAYESCEEGIVKCGLSGYANAKKSSTEDVPWYKTDTFKWVVGAAVVVGTVVAAAVVLTVAAPAILTAVVVGAAIGAATGSIAGFMIGGITSEKNGGTFAEGAADGFFWGSIGGAVSGAVAGVAIATEAGLLSMCVAQGIVGAGMYTAETNYDGGQVSAAGLALSFTTTAVMSAGSVVLAGKASQLLGKLSGVLKNGSRQTVSAAESVIDVSQSVTKKSADTNFTWKLRGEDVTLDNVAVQDISYVKRSTVELQSLRNEFNTTTRKTFLADIGENTEYLKNAGFSDADILKIQNGRVPDGWQVHHKLPLDDSGTNTFDNLVLIKNEPYHKVITNYQNSTSRNLEVGDVQTVQWPVPNGKIYPSQH